MKKIAVFCGSSMGNKPIYKQAAKELALEFIKNKISLIYGGANVGIMKILADTMLEHDSEVIGVMPESIVEKEVAHYGISKLHIVKSMGERKDMMAQLSDAFIALPGGFGTLDELAEVLTYSQLRIFDKAVGILNINGYYDHLISFLDKGVEDGYIRAEHRNNIIVSDNPHDILHKLNDFKPIEMGKWIDDIKEESKN